MGLSKVSKLWHSLWLTASFFYTLELRGKILPPTNYIVREMCGQEEGRGLVMLFPPWAGLRGAQLPRCGHCKGAGDLVIVLSHHQRTPSDQTHCSMGRSPQPQSIRPPVCVTQPRNLMAGPVQFSRPVVIDATAIPPSSPILPPRPPATPP